MWDILSCILDTTSHTVGRQSLKPTAGESIDAWFVKLVDIRNRLLDTLEAIRDITFKTHIFNSLPEAFDATSRILQNEPDHSVEEIIARLKRDDQTRAMRVKSEATTEAHHSATNAGRGRGRGCGGRRGRASERVNLWCTLCCTTTHDTVDYRSKQWGHKRKRNADNSTESKESKEPQVEGGKCFHCGETGYFIACLGKKRGDEACGKKKKQRNVKMEAENGYCRYSAASMAYDSEVMLSTVPKQPTSEYWAVDSVATDHMCNNTQAFTGQLIP
jgi:hypothetical protein